MMTNHFSGPSSEIGPVCLSLYAWTNTFELHFL